DTDFSWREFIYSHNGELLGAYGNFVNRTLKFIEKYYGGSCQRVELIVSQNPFYLLFTKRQAV
ncbi:class I tRNA ligase family protein, partial [Fictibacillus sp. B-59209]|uniref:class I tRNA ligase family protein n=1 Tax=Fictibacillus sp. B-59209 TaxID=3024873 RepID=UPI002E23B161|nr:class I tRNA ligase family protein [Fictibacillus sp. B-59209]